MKIFVLLFIELLCVNCCINADRIDLNYLDHFIYRGDYKTAFYEGVAEYLYVNKSDGSRVYDGQFRFQGKCKYSLLFDHTSMIGRLMVFRTKEEENYYERMKISKGKRNHERVRKIKIEGRLVNGLKCGRWITVTEEYNFIKDRYVPIDSCIFNYSEGYLDGNQYYVHYNIIGQLRKKEIIKFVSNKVLNATVYHYGYRCEKYESYYNEDGKPKGVWIEKRDNGTYYLDFDKGEAYFKNDQTGFVEGVRPIKGFLASAGRDIHPFEHAFFENGSIANFYYDQRVGAFGVGDYNVGDNYRGYRTRVINQIVGTPEDKLNFPNIESLDNGKLSSETKQSIDPSNSIGDLIVKWNELHTSNMNSVWLEAFYAPTVKFYGQVLSSKDCVKKVIQFMSKYESFSQCTVGNISQTTLSDSCIRCDFTKCVTVNGSAKNYPAYLVFRKDGDDWNIVVESDKQTDAYFERLRKKK